MTHSKTTNKKFIVIYNNYNELSSVALYAEEYEFNEEKALMLTM